MTDKKRDLKRPKRKVQMPEPRNEDEAIEQDWMRDMVGDEDAAYFSYAGIDDIGNK